LQNIYIKIQIIDLSLQYLLFAKPYIKAW